MKAVAVLLALHFLGIKGIPHGTTLPAFASPSVLKVLVDSSNIKPVSDVKTDVEAMINGQ